MQAVQKSYCELLNIEALMISQKPRSEAIAGDGLWKRGQAHLLQQPVDSVTQKVLCKITKLLDSTLYTPKPCCADQSDYLWHSTSRDKHLYRKIC